MVVLAARRAANTGRRVIVVTSNEWSDDALVDTLKTHGVHYFRGSLDNVLDRVVSALAGYDDEAIVLRVTADNVFPDGALIDEVESDFLARGCGYLCCNGERSGLPYGVSIEATRLRYLREAERHSRDPLDHEHVTPYVIRKFGRQYFEKYKNMQKGHLRCTVDCLDDYLVVRQVFSGAVDPERESVFDLVRRLALANFQPSGEKLVPRLVFGAAQLGSNYGIANRTGQPDISTARELIKTAIVNGVQYIDSARAYGNSEEVIRSALQGGWESRVKVITKLSPLVECPPDADAETVRAFVDASVFRSCVALGVPKIEVMMLHRASHLWDWGGAVWNRLCSLRAMGLIGEFGVSVQSPQELATALENPEIHYIQMPFNLMDWRWDAVIPQILAAKASRRLTVHVRSALLQGLLPSQDEALWRRARVDFPQQVMGWLRDQANRFQRDGVTDLSLAYLNAQPWVDGVAVGMEHMAQLMENIRLFGATALSCEQVEEIRMSRPVLGERTLNPALWRAAS